MALAGMHKEDVKAALRKQFGSVAEFERQKNLPGKSVADLLRGYTSARVEKAVTDAINFPSSVQSEGSDDSTEKGATHRLTRKRG